MKELVRLFVAINQVIVLGPDITDVDFIRLIKHLVVLLSHRDLIDPLKLSFFENNNSVWQAIKHGYKMKSILLSSYLECISFGQLLFYEVNYTEVED
jgi:hypothetical protein